jgi:hypothetical protein
MPKESKESFVGRYMGDPESNKKYPDQAQRSAIAYSIYEQNKVKKGPTLAIDPAGNVFLK